MANQSLGGLIREAIARGFALMSVVLFMKRWRAKWKRFLNLQIVVTIRDPTP